MRGATSIDLLGVYYPNTGESNGKREMENEMETSILKWFVSIKVSQNWGYHFEGPNNKE